MQILNVDSFTETMRHAEIVQIHDTKPLIRMYYDDPKHKQRGKHRIVFDFEDRVARLTIIGHDDTIEYPFDAFSFAQAVEMANKFNGGDDER